MDRYCDGLTRRDALRVGVLSALGLSLPDLLRMQAAQAAPKRDVNCILVFQTGGPSQLETFDMKPDGPPETRGEFKAISTNVDGIRISEHLPKLAKVTDKYSILRSVSGAHYMCTGKNPTAGFQEGLNRPNNQHPFIGSVVSRAKGVRRDLPPYIGIPTLLTYGGPAFLGPSYMPFVIESDPASPSFSVRDLRSAPGVEEARQDERRRLRAALDAGGRSQLVKPNPKVAALDTFYSKAYDLVTSPAAQKAFDLNSETPKIRDEYSRTTFGQSCLLARRMVESGCRFVSIEHAGWDNHTTIFQTLKDDLLPEMDAGLSALVRDLSDRGMLDSTLVLAFGEFGRTAKINKEVGRDHWPQVASVFIAGGGIKNGVVVGATDAAGEYPTERPISPEDLAATVYRCLGVDHRMIVETPLGRPVQIVSDGEPIRELL
ncbi:MAG: hypothetical protein K0Q72_5430 [Armatimonadetes bacterium]|nr:hypothetical protein [Armatimonadota bacterium]